MKISLLKQKNFSLLITGKLVSLIGSNIQQFALSLYVLAITGSATVFASMLSISILPRLLLSPIAGVFGDWFDRKKTIVLLDFVNAFIIGVFAVLFILNQRLSLLSIYVLVILLEVTEIFFHSAMSAVMPSLVKKEELMEANALNSLVMNMGNMLSPIIAAFLYATFGLRFILVMNACSFALSAISEMFINIPKSHKQPEKINLASFHADLVDGIRIIRSNKLISTVIGLGTIINFAMAPLFGIGLIYIIKEILLVSDLQFGIFQMVLSASMILAPLLCGSIMHKMKIGKLAYLSFLITASLVLVMAIFPSRIMLSSFPSSFLPYAGILIISFMIGLVVTITNIAIGTIFNQIVPLDAMGRTSAVFNLAVTVFVPVGQMLFGLLYDILSADIVIAISGLIVIIATRLYKTALLRYDETLPNSADHTIESNNVVANHAIDAEQLISEVGV